MTVATPVRYFYSHIDGQKQGRLRCRRHAPQRPHEVGEAVGTGRNVQMVGQNSHHRFVKKKASGDL